MKNKSGLFLLSVAVMIIVITVIVVFMLIRASDINVNSGMKYLEFQGIVEDLRFAPAPGADNGFVVNPYLVGNPDQNQAVIIGASVSYILREVKSFTMFAVVLAVFALIAYVIIACIVFNRILKPVVKAEEPQKNEEAVMKNEEYDNNNKEPGDCIEDRTSSAAILSRSIDKTLSDIDAVMERSQRKWSFLL